MRFVEVVRTFFLPIRYQAEAWLLKSFGRETLSSWRFSFYPLIGQWANDPKSSKRKVSKNWFFFGFCDKPDCIMIDEFNLRRSSSLSSRSLFLWFRKSFLDLSFRPKKHLLLHASKNCHQHFVTKTFCRHILPDILIFLSVTFPSKLRKLILGLSFLKYFFFSKPKLMISSKIECSRKIENSQKIENSRAHQYLCFMILPIFALILKLRH